MLNLNTLSHQIKRMLFSRKGLYTILVLFCLFLLLLMIRGCNEINSKQVLYRIGRDPQWYSLNLMNKEKNMTAFSDDLLNAIAQQEDIRFAFFPISPNEQLVRLESGQLDGVLSSLEPNVFMAKNFLFSEPYFLLGPVLITRTTPGQAGNEANSKYKIIGIQSQLAPISEMSQEPSIQFQLYDNPLKALSDVDEGRIDAAILPALQAYIYTRTFYPSRLKVATTPLTQEGFRLVTLKNERGQTLIDHFDRGLKIVEQNGIYDQLIEQWNLIDPEVIEQQQGFSGQ